MVVNYFTFTLHVVSSLLHNSKSVNYFTFTLPVVTFLLLNWMVVNYFTFTLPVVSSLLLNSKAVSFTLPVVSLLHRNWMVVSYFTFTLTAVSFLLLRRCYTVISRSITSSPFMSPPGHSLTVTRPGSDPLILTWRWPARHS